jgi:hypothetical protein
MDAGENELFNFVTENKMPCFASLQIDDNKCEDVYFYRLFKSDCFTAKCYDENLFHMSNISLINRQRPSTTYFETADIINNNDNNNNNTNSKMTPFYEILIPFNYQG